MMSLVYCVFLFLLLIPEQMQLQNGIMLRFWSYSMNDI